MSRLLVVAAIAAIAACAACAYTAAHKPTVERNRYRGYLSRE
jgi:hypothetical protein